MNVSAIIVTRGDVDLTPVLASLPEEWETVVWDNGTEKLWVKRREGYEWLGNAADLSVYGRYAAIEYAHAELIYVQDDDCVVSDPRAIVHAWLIGTQREGHPEGTVVCNMPAGFRDQPQYAEGDSALVGFGACFHRDAPERAFQRFSDSPFTDEDEDWLKNLNHPFFARTCDIVFTALTPRVLVDVPYENLPWAEAENRMWKQRTHIEERMRMLELVRKVRDA